MPYQFVPSLMNVKMSQRLAVVVKVGAMPLGHLTLVNVPVKPPAPVLAIRMNDWPVTAVGIVNVQLPVMVTVWAVPVDRDKVTAVELLPMLTVPSVY